MKRVTMNTWIRKACVGIFSLALICVLGLTAEQFAVVSHAQSQGKVTADSANIRKEPSASSQALGSAEKDASVTINHQTTGSDGAVWYQVFVNADTLGYIRSDLVTITDGSTPTTVDASSTTTSTTITPAPSTTTTETPVTVTAVEPVSATVTGGENVRVRSNASTTSQIVTTVAKGSALTITGQATGTDGKVWYQVAFIANGADVTGFIRTDFVNISGDVIPVTQAPQETETTEPEPPQEAEEPEEIKTWETQLQGEKWYLLNMDKAEQYEIDKLFSAIDANGEAFDESQKTVKSQKIIIVVLVFVVVLLSAGVAFLIFKINDMKDSAYFAEVERDTARRRSTERTQDGQKVMHTVGADKKSGAGAQGSRPQGNRPQGNRPQGARPQGSTPQGARPEGAQPQSKPRTTQPVGNRPVGEKTATRPPVQPGGDRPVAKPAAQPQQNVSKKPKNFMADDDEFEFEFLNWDGEEE